MAILPTPFVVLVEHTCGKCGIVFAMPADYYAARKKDGETWYCPNGDARAFTGETEADKLRQELKTANDRLASKQSWIDQLSERNSELYREVEHKNRRINGYKGAVARVKRRVAKGRCPCCSHEFKDLEKHMVSRHPNWDSDKHAATLAETGK